MADNLVVATGSGGTVATDDIGNIHYQRVKLAFGADGSSADVSTSHAVPVTMQSGTVGAVTPGTGAAALGKAEDAAHSSGDTGVMALAVRKNEAAALAGADGDYIPVITDASGAAWVHASDGTVALKGAVLVGNTGTVTLAGSTSVVHLNNAGTVAAISTSVTPGTGAANLGKAEDAAHSSGDTGVMALGVQKNENVGLAGTDGDYAPLQVAGSGALFVHVVAGTVTSSASGTQYTEDSAHNSGDTGNLVLSVRKNEPAASSPTDGDYAVVNTDANGALWTHVNDGTVGLKGAVLLGNTGTVTLVGSTSVVHVSNAATVTLTGTNPTFQTNNGTVSVSGAVLTGNTGTVTLVGSTSVVHVNNAGTVASVTNLGSVTTGHGHTLAYAAVNLTATGTVVAAISSKKIKVFAEQLTVAAGTVTLTTQSGAAGGTIRGPMQFSPTGGFNWANPIDSPLYETAAGSPLVYTLVNILGSGTVGGVIGYFQEA